MGQKVNPIGLRLGINKTWDSRWFSQKAYAATLHEDLKIRQYIFDNLTQAGISKVVIERPASKARVNIHTARPGVLIGKKGADLDQLKAKLSKFAKSELSINVVEVRKPEIDAKIIADGIAQQIERRVSFRRAMKRGMQTAMKMGAQGIRVNCSGRLGGAEIARMEWYIEGKVPLHTLRSDIDFAIGVAQTTYGVIGIKVWVYKGQILDNATESHEKGVSSEKSSHEKAPYEKNTRERAPRERRDERKDRGHKGKM